MDKAIEPITETFFFIQRGWLSANHFVQTVPEPVLIDTAYLPALEETERLIAQTGVTLDEVSLIINTHAHCDHIGGNAHIHKRSGCKIALHATDRYFVDQGNDMALWWGYYGQEADFFPTHQSLAEGQVLTLGGLDWQVIHSPGHSMGQVLFFAPDTGWLISGDTAWDGDFGVLTTRIEGLDAPLRLMESLTRLAELPVTRMFPGHGPIVNDGPAAIEKCIQRLAHFLETPLAMGLDQLKKILIYTVMMRGPLTGADLFDLLKRSIWFPEVCSLYLGGDLDRGFKGPLDELLGKGVLELRGDLLYSRLPA